MSFPDRHQQPDAWNEQVNGAGRRLLENISDALESFGRTFNLGIEKYRYGVANWSFHFRHPKGGLGTVQIMASHRFPSEDPTDISHFIIAPHWSVDYVELGERRIHWGTHLIAPLNDPATTRDLLEEALVRTVSWEISDLTHVAGGMRDSWSSSHAEQARRNLDAQTPTPDFCSLDKPTKL